MLPLQHFRGSISGNIGLWIPCSLNVKSHFYCCTQENRNLQSWIKEMSCSPLILLNNQCRAWKCIIQFKVGKQQHGMGTKHTAIIAVAYGGFTNMVVLGYCTLK